MSKCNNPGCLCYGTGQSCYPTPSMIKGNHIPTRCIQCGGHTNNGDPFCAKCEKEQPKDNCQVCKGSKGGVRGNENIIRGIVMCDYCTSENMENNK